MELQQDLLLDLEDGTSYERATPGIRFVNYLIDFIVLRVLFYAITNTIATTNPDGYYNFYNGMSRMQIFFTNYLFSILLFTLYYTLFEGAANGKTLGKLATGTRAVNYDGGKLTWKEAFLRSISRFVPFEPFSAFGGYPWHDAWTTTQVVKFKKRF